MYILNSTPEQGTYKEYTITFTEFSRINVFKTDQPTRFRMQDRCISTCVKNLYIDNRRGLMFRHAVKFKPWIALLKVKTTSESLKNLQSHTKLFWSGFSKNDIDYYYNL